MVRTFSEKFDNKHSDGNFKYKIKKLENKIHFKHNTAIIASTNIVKKLFYNLGAKSSLKNQLSKSD